ncbi:dihydroorotase, partial [Patescibacteria group bacterium]|nr:dihydroorotase [Patescibacteria group bacterium]
METLVIRKPDDFHIHLREGELFCRVLPFTAQVFARALVMPNLSEPLVNTVKVKEYFREVDKYCQRHGFKDFRALRTLYLTDDTRASEIAWSQVW